MAEAGKEQAGLALPGGGAAQWPLQRYGRFMPSGTGEPPGPGQDAGAASSPTWKVFDSNEESGYLVLTIVISGHFFISQGQTLLHLRSYLAWFESYFAQLNADNPYDALLASCSHLKDEGFSLIGGKNWLKIVRRTDCLLFGTTVKRNSLPMVGKTASVGVRVVMGNFIQTDLGNESKTSRKTEQNKSRMFRVQFGGGSKEQALEHCGSCVQKLAQYVTVQVPDRVSQELGLSPGPLRAGESRAQHVPPQQGPPQNPEKPQPCGPASTSASGGRSSVSSLAQSLLVSEARPPVCEQSAWDAEELGPFLRLCLMDQNFPAFVEEVEKELKKLTGLRN